MSNDTKLENVSKNKMNELFDFDWMLLLGRRDKEREKKQKQKQEPAIWSKPERKTRLQSDFKDLHNNNEKKEKKNPKKRLCTLSISRVDSWD